MYNEQKNDEMIYEIISANKTAIEKYNIESIKSIDLSISKGMLGRDDIYFLVKCNKEATATDLLNFRDMIKKLFLKADLYVGVHTEDTLNQEVQKSHISSQIRDEIIKRASLNHNLLDLEKLEQEEPMDTSHEKVLEKNDIEQITKQSVCEANFENTSKEPDVTQTISSLEGIIEEFIKLKDELKKIERQGPLPLYEKSRLDILKAFISQEQLHLNELEKKSYQNKSPTRFSDNRSLTFFPKENKNNTKKMKGLSLKSEPMSLT